VNCDENLCAKFIKDPHVFSRTKNGLMLMNFIYIFIYFFMYFDFFLSKTRSPGKEKACRK